MTAPSPDNPLFHTPFSLDEGSPWLELAHNVGASIHRNTVPLYRRQTTVEEYQAAAVETLWALEQEFEATEDHHCLVAWCLTYLPRRTRQLLRSMHLHPARRRDYLGPKETLRMASASLDVMVEDGGEALLVEGGLVESAPMSPGSRRSFEELVSALPLTDFEGRLLELRFWEGLSYTELERETGVSKGNLSVTHFPRLWEKLRQYFDARGLTPDELLASYTAS